MLLLLGVKDLPTRNVIIVARHRRRNGWAVVDLLRGGGLGCLLHEAMVLHTTYLLVHAQPTTTRRLGGYAIADASWTGNTGYSEAVVARKVF